MSNLTSPSHNPNDIARLVLQETLAAKPRYGAQLKPLVMNGLRQHGVDPFAFFGRFPKFSAFLAANSDLVQVTPRADGADVWITLRGPDASVSPTVAPNEQIRPDVWRAFTNPDSKRRRFVKRDTAEVRHFTEPARHPTDQLWERKVSADSSYIPIEFASAQTQSNWMRDFLSSAAGLPEWMRRASSHLTEIPFGSSVETAFTHILGPQFGAAWRHFRFERVLELMKAWASKNDFPSEKLFIGTNGSQTVGPQEPGLQGLRAIPEPQLIADSSRAGSAILLLQALELCTPEELQAIRLPASLVVRLIRNQ